MDRLQDLLGNAPEELLMRSGALSQLSLLEIEQKRAEVLNRERGSLVGYECPDCLNRGYFVRVDDEGRRRSEECKCMDTRRSMEGIKRSGLASLLERYTYETWQANERWQKKALVLAKSYAAKPGGSWFMMTGRSGSGKTHLCTALCADLMRNGKRVKYMLWRDVSVLAKAVVNDEEEYRRIVDPLKTVPVLYIDDLFKAGKDEKGNVKVTPGDINLAFAIINYRYSDSRKLTIISSERSVGTCFPWMKLWGSRIYERTRDFYIPLDGAKNWRMG